MKDSTSFVLKITEKLIGQHVRIDKQQSPYTNINFPIKKETVYIAIK